MLTAQKPGVYVATVIVEDKFEMLNPRYRNYAATVMLTVKVLPQNLSLEDVLVSAVLGGSVHRFEAQGGAGGNTYTMIAGDRSYFSLGERSGILSLRGNALVGGYTISIEVMDVDGEQASALAIVEVVPPLFLSSVPRLTATVGMTVGLYTLTASGGIGAKSYRVLVEDGYFVVDVFGVLSMQANAEEGLYTLTIQAMDEHHNEVESLATVSVDGSAGTRQLGHGVDLLLSDAPPIYALADLLVDVSVHTFAAVGGFGEKTYRIVSDNDAGYFALGGDGVLSLRANAPLGDYILSVMVVDSAIPRHQAMALATVNVVRNKIYVLGGYNSNIDPNRKNDVWSSVDGEHWSRDKGNNNDGWTGRTGYQVVSHRGSLYVLGGEERFRSIYKNDVWSSRDGIDWSRKTGESGWSARYSHQAVSHRGSLYVLGGALERYGARKNDVWSSVDGEHWSQEKADNDEGWSKRSGHQVVSHNGRLYVLGGTFHEWGPRKNDVWSSLDGKIWSLETADAGWSVRNGHQALSYQGRLYVLGGDYSRKNDVWSSVDGKIWRQEKGNNDEVWPGRYYHQVLSYQGLLYVLGGGDGYSSYRRDVWSSGDGRSWTQKTGRAGWRSRESHQAVVFPPSLLLEGVGERLRVTSGIAVGDLHTFASHYGDGNYTYSLLPEVSGFSLGGDGILSFDGGAGLGTHTLTVWVEDGEGTRAQTALWLDVLGLERDDEVLSLAIYVGGALSLRSHIDEEASTYSLLGGNDGGDFMLDGESGLLSLGATSSAGTYTLLVEVADASGLSRRVSLVLSAALPLLLSDAPPINVLAGLSVVVSVHTFMAVGGFGSKTYTIVAGNEAGYFALGERSGELLALGQATAGIYTLLVQVGDARGNTAQAQAVLEILPGLSLVDAPPLFALAGVSVEVVHTFTAIGGVGVKTYTIVAGNDDGYFALGEESGVLLALGQVSVGIYTLSVHAIDSRGYVAQALATVEVLSLFLADAPRLSVVVGREEELHVFMAVDAIGGETYTLLSSDDNYFVVNATMGALSVLSSAPVGIYTLSVGVSDSLKSQVEALAIVEVVSSLGLSAVPRLTAVAEEGVNLYTLVVSGGIGAKTYNLVSDTEGYFEVNASLGVLSLSSGASAGLYTLVMKVIDEHDNIAQALATVEISAVFPLLLSVVPRIYVLASLSVGVKVHTFTAAGGIGSKTYTLLVGVEDYFIVNATTGVLSVRAMFPVGTYTLLVGIEDAMNSMIEVSLIIDALSPLLMSDAPRIDVLAGLSVGVSVYTFIAEGGLGSKTYRLASGDEAGYFALDGESGVLWMGANVPLLDDYVLSVVVLDSGMHQVTAVLTVNAVRNKIFVLGGGGGFKNDVWSSLDGKNWLQEKGDDDHEGWSKRSDYQVVSHNGRLYVLGGGVSRDNGGRKNDVWSSGDGIHWSLETADAGWSRRLGHQAVSYRGRLYVLGGNYYGNFGDYKNDIWSSADGAHWSQEKGNDHEGWSKRSGHQVVSHNGRLYVLGGTNYGDYNNDVWSLVDGKNWLLETADAGWSGRHGHQALSYQGRLYVLGGGYHGRNDVWSSADGKVWRQETVAANWPRRTGHQVLSYQGLLYVLGGEDTSYHHFEDGYRKNDVWSSANGQDWSRKTSSAEWSGRSGHQAVVFPPSLFLEGVGERLRVTVGTMSRLHTFRARYGDGDYTYSLSPRVSGFEVSEGVLSANGTAELGVYRLTVWVADGEGTRAQTAVWVDVVQTLSLEDVQIVVLADREGNVHTFTALGDDVGGKTYRIVSGNELGYFDLGEESGMLSVVNAAVGSYTLLVEVRDRVELSHWGTARVEVEVVRNKMYVLGGYGRNPYYTNDVWSSVDGEHWSRDKGNNNEGWSQRSGHQVVSHRGSLYVLGGSSSLYGHKKNDVWSSGDGIDWFRQTGHAGWSARSGHQAVSHRGRLYVLGGALDSYGVHNNDVWSSVDGKDWSLETADAGWSARAHHQALSHQGRLYVLGACCSANDVWSSADGKIWRQEKGNNNGGWSRRYAHQALSYQGLLHVLGGGETYLDYTRDVWSSGDGRSWSEKTGHADWRARYEHQAVVFPPSLLLEGVGERVRVTSGIAVGELHTFVARYGDGKYTYSLSPELSGFALGGDGVLSSDGRATLGTHMLTVWVDDGEGSRAQTAVWVDIVGINRVDVLSLSVYIGGAVSLQTYIGEEASTYVLLADEEYFVIDADGVLSLKAAVPAGIYTVLVGVKDTMSMRRVLVIIDVIDVLADLSMGVNVHTFMVKSDFGAKTYALVSGNEVGYLGIGSESGLWSVANAAVGSYIL